MARRLAGKIAVVTGGTTGIGFASAKRFLVATLAQPGDPSNDATKVSPADREHVDIGTLIVRQAQDEADGPCRDLQL
jgi:NAD(P)-dependent dehydrogenase (short-subunit alcohol dehydrogenase family)